MTKILVTSREGGERSVDISLGGHPTLMEAIRNDGSFDLVAMCGGMLSCSTCHVYIDPAWVDRIDSISDEERELIESSDYYAPNSRLSCQIRLDESHEGLRVSVAPQD